MKEFQKPILKNVAIGFAIVLAVVLIEWQYGYPFFHLLTDGFFIAAVMMLGIGGITAAVNAGCFDMMGYSMKSLLGVVIPGSRLADNHDEESFLDYKERKAEKRKSPLPMIVAGGFHLSIAILMLIIYYMTT